MIAAWLDSRGITCMGTHAADSVRKLGVCGMQGVCLEAVGCPAAAGPPKTNGMQESKRLCSGTRACLLLSTRVRAPYRSRGPRVVLLHAGSSLRRLSFRCAWFRFVIPPRGPTSLPHWKLVKMESPGPFQFNGGRRTIAEQWHEGKEGQGVRDTYRGLPLACCSAYTARCCSLTGWS